MSSPNLKAYNLTLNPNAYVLLPACGVVLAGRGLGSESLDHAARVDAVGGLGLRVLGFRA